MHFFTLRPTNFVVAADSISFVMLWSVPLSVSRKFLCVTVAIMQMPVELECVNSRPKLDYSGPLFWTSTNWTLTFRLVNFAIVGHYLLVIIMTALCNRAGHYIFAMWFLSSSIFFCPRQSQWSEIGCLPYFHVKCRTQKIAKKFVIWAPSCNFVGLYLRK